MTKEQLVEQIYYKVIQTANEFLHNAKTFKITVLQLRNPTYAEIAEQFKEISAILQVLCDELNDPMTGTNAADYVRIMVGMAEAISAEDEDRLQQHVSELDRRSML